MNRSNKRRLLIFVFAFMTAVPCILVTLGIRFREYTSTQIDKSIDPNFRLFDPRLEPNSAVKVLDYALLTLMIQYRRNEPRFELLKQINTEYFKRRKLLKYLASLKLRFTHSATRVGMGDSYSLRGPTYRGDWLSPRQDPDLSQLTGSQNPDDYYAAAQKVYELNKNSRNSQFAVVQQLLDQGTALLHSQNESKYIDNMVRLYTQIKAFDQAYDLILRLDLESTLDGKDLTCHYAVQQEFDKAFQMLKRTSREDMYLDHIHGLLCLSENLNSVDKLKPEYLNILDDLLTKTQSEVE